MPISTRHVLLALGALTLAASTAALRAGAAPVPPSPPSITDLKRATREAYAAKDYRAYRTSLRQLYRRLDGEPDLLFALAKAEARLGRPAAALADLRAFAAMGLARDLAAEPDLASLRKNPAFAAIERRFAANRVPVERSTPLFTLPENDLITEDIAFDPATRTFYVSSVRHRKILAIDPSGHATDFVPEGADGIGAVLALSVDSRRHVLWATTAALPEALGYQAADAGHTAVLRYDLASGRLLERYDLVAARAGDKHALGDMTLGPAGDVYVSDGASGAVYVIRPDHDAVEILIEPGTFLSPQTPAATPDGRRLFVADYGKGIGIVDLASRRTTWLAHPKTVAVSGVDGLYLVGRTLLAIENGNYPVRVLRLDLDGTLTRVVRSEVIERGPRLGSPTHGVVVDGALDFLANSGWDRMGDDGAPTPGAVFTAPAILRSPPL